MATIPGLTYLSNDRVFAVGVYPMPVSIPINAISRPVPVGGVLDVKNHRVYVGTGDGRVALFRGSISNSPEFVPVTKEPIQSLAHAAGAVYVGTGLLGSTGPYEVIALDDQTLKVRWRAKLPGPVNTSASFSYEAGDPRPKQVIVSSETIPMVCGLDPDTGGALWRVKDLAIFGQIVYEGIVYYCNVIDGSLCARSATDGRLVWTYRRGPSFFLPTAARGVVWASTEDGYLVAVNAADGALLWIAPIPGRAGTPVAYFDDPNGIALVAVAEQINSTDGYMRALDPNTGLPLWTSSVPVSRADRSCSDPIIADGIQVGTYDGMLMAFDIRNGVLSGQVALTPGSSLLVTPSWAPA